MVTSTFKIGKSLLGRSPPVASSQDVLHSARSLSNSPAVSFLHTSVSFLQCRHGGVKAEAAAATITQQLSGYTDRVTRRDTSR